MSAFSLESVASDDVYRYENVVLPIGTKAVPSKEDPSRYELPLLVIDGIPTPVEFLVY